MEQAIMATGVVLVGLQILSTIIHILHYAYFKKRLDRIERMIPQPVTYEDMNKIEALLNLDDWWIET